MPFTQQETAKIQAQENKLRGGSNSLKVDGLMGPQTIAAIIARYDKLAPIVNPPVKRFDGIIDINHQNGFDVEALWNTGIRAVIHKGTQGTSYKDGKHADRRASWKSRDGLWGSYTFLIKDINPVTQADFFLDWINYRTGDVLAVDWENNPNGGDPPTPEEVAVVLKRIRERTGVTADLYFGNALTDIIASGNGTIPKRHAEAFEEIKKSRPWYVRLASSPLQFPYIIWPDGPWLWQNREGNIPGSDGADGNVFFGTESELRNGWSPGA